MNNVFVAVLTLEISRSPDIDKMTTKNSSMLLNDVILSFKVKALIRKILTLINFAGSVLIILDASNLMQYLIEKNKALIFLLFQLNRFFINSAF